MTATLRGTLEYSESFDATSSGRTVKNENLLAFAMQLAAGTAAGQIDKIFDETRTITSGNNYDYDLAGGLTGANGVAITLARLKVLLVQLRTATDGRILTIGAGGANSFNSWCGSDTDVIKLGGSGLLVLGAPLATGYVVTAGTADILRFAASGGDIQYDVIMLGCSA